MISPSVDPDGHSVPSKLVPLYRVLQQVELDLAGQLPVAQIPSLVRSLIW
jgi:hypothetical protein